MPRLSGGIGRVHGAEEIKEPVLPVRLRPEPANLVLVELAGLFVVTADGGFVCLRAQPPRLLPTAGVLCEQRVGVALIMQCRHAAIGLGTPEHFAAA